MYLTATRYLWTSEGDLSEQIAALFPEVGNLRVKEVAIEAGYWRKANAIHAWFVKNIQEGVDECDKYDIHRGALASLSDLCREVLTDRSKAKELLPTASGFFFGDYDYDDWYFEKLESTVKIIEAALALPEDWDFTYHSSW